MFKNKKLSLIRVLPCFFQTPAQHSPAEKDEDNYTHSPECFYSPKYRVNKKNKKNRKKCKKKAFIFTSLTCTSSHHCLALYFNH